MTLRPFWTNTFGSLYRCQVLDGLRALPEKSVHCCVSSPPYWGLRKYAGEQESVWGGDRECEHEWAATEEPGGCGTGESFRRDRKAGRSRGGTQPGFCLKCGAWFGALGLEPTPELFVKHIVHVYREVWRALRDDGVCWLNIGDSYAGSWGNMGSREGGQRKKTKGRIERPGYENHTTTPPMATVSTKPKSLCLIPERLALSLQEDGWIVRSRIAWTKASCMPESVQDRPTSSWEHLFMLVKQGKYFYDSQAVRQPASDSYAQDGRHLTGSNGQNIKEGYEEAGAQNPKGPHRMFRGPNGPTRSPHGQGFTRRSGNKERKPSRQPDEAGPATSVPWEGFSSNLRNHWHLGPSPFPEAHFATFVPEVPRRAIRASTSEKGCCSECGAPWERVVERKPNPTGINGGEHREPGRDGALGKRNRDYESEKDFSGRSIGWAPTCHCDYEWNGPFETTPCTVLDPFMGSGTTAVVAQELDRRWIGIDASKEYCEMAKRRILREVGESSQIRIGL